MPLSRGGEETRARESGGIAGGEGTSERRSRGGTEHQHAPDGKSVAAQRAEVQAVGTASQPRNGVLPAPRGERDDQDELDPGFARETNGHVVRLHRLGTPLGSLNGDLPKILTRKENFPGRDAVPLIMSRLQAQQVRVNPSHTVVCTRGRKKAPSQVVGFP